MKRRVLMLTKRRKFGNSVFKRVSFYVLAVIFSLSFFLVFLDSFRFYEAGFKIEIAAQNEKLSKDVLQGMSDLIRTLGFYEKVIADNKMLKDYYSGLEKDEKKEKWIKSVKTNIDNDGKYLEAKVYTKNRLQSSMLAKQTARSLSDSISYYYDIKNDVKLVITDGKFAKPVIRNWTLLLFSSIIFGFALSYFFNALYLKFNPKELKVEDKMMPFEAHDEEKFAGSYGEKTAGVILEKKDSFWMKRNKAPDNLPILNETTDEIDYVINYQSKSANNQSVDDQTTDEREPTQEELKRRLNQLLSGEL